MSFISILSLKTTNSDKNYFEMILTEMFRQKGDVSNHQNFKLVQNTDIGLEIL